MIVKHFLINCVFFFIFLNNMQIIKEESKKRILQLFQIMATRFSLYQNLLFKRKFSILRTEWKLCDT